MLDMILELKGYAQYEAITSTMRILIYDYLTEAEFEESWNVMITYELLGANGWEACTRSDVSGFRSL